MAKITRHRDRGRVGTLIVDTDVWNVPLVYRAFVFQRRLLYRVLVVYEVVYRRLDALLWLEYLPSVYPSDGSMK